ncbi:MAG: pseudouridine synthase [Bacillota bacterium]
MRLQHYLAVCGIASRRKCETLIAQGRVRVNGVIVDKAGINVEMGTDRVELDGKPVAPAGAPVCYMLYKERGVISSCSDPQGRTTVMSYFKGAKERLFPVGRLDYDTEGLLLVTNDGTLAYRLTHPRYEVNKTYTAVVRGQLKPSQIRRLEKGVEVDGVRTAPAHVQVVEAKPGEATARITLHEGKNRQVRKMFLAVGLPVKKLKREQIGSLSLGNLKPGQVRKLKHHEIQRLLDEAMAGEFAKARKSNIRHDQCSKGNLPGP